MKSKKHAKVYPRCTTTFNSGYTKKFCMSNTQKFAAHHDRCVWDKLCFEYDLSGRQKLWRVCANKITLS